MKRENQSKHLAPKKKRARKTAKRVTIVCVVVVALLLAGAAGFGVYVSGSDTIYPKVSDSFFTILVAFFFAATGSSPLNIY